MIHENELFVDNGIHDYVIVKIPGQDPYLGLFIPLEENYSSCGLIQTENGKNVVSNKHIFKFSQTQNELFGLMIDPEYDLAQFLFENKKAFKEAVEHFIEEDRALDDENYPLEKSALELFLGLITFQEFVLRHDNDSFEGKPGKPGKPELLFSEGDLVDTPEGAGIIYDFDYVDKRMKVLVRLFSAIENTVSYLYEDITQPTPEQKKAYEELI